jgi:hypothetical protein
MAVNGSETKQARRTATVNLPFVTAQFRAPDLHMPRVHMPDRQEINSTLRTVASYLPPPRKVLYFGGLALAAALEVIEWPVAAAVAVGTAVAGSGDKRDRSDQPAAEEATAAKGSATRTPTRRTKS